MGNPKPLSYLSLQTVVNNPSCVSAAAQLCPKYRHLILAWLAAHDLLVDQNYLNALDLFLATKPLQWAELDCGKALNPQSLTCLFPHCQNLQWLSLKCSCSRSVDGMRALLGNLKQVRHVEIRGAIVAGYDSLSTLKSARLKTLILDVETYNEDSGNLEILLLNNPSIRVFSFCDSNRSLSTKHNSDMLVRQISATLSTQLTELTLYQVNIQKEAFSCLLLSCTRLQILKLSGCFEFDSNTMRRVAVECKWKQFELDFLQFMQDTESNNNLEALVHLPPTISSLGLGATNKFPTYHVNNISQTIMSLPNLHRLRYYSEFKTVDILTEQLFSKIGHKLYNLDIKVQLPKPAVNQLFRTIANHCRSLESLNIYDLEDLGPLQSDGMPLKRIIETPQRAAKIKVLSLTHIALSIDFLQTVARNCINLEELYLQQIENVHDAFLITLANNCPKLHVMDISCCPFVTDKGVCVLAERLSLSSLNIRNCRKLTDATILALEKNCTRLKSLICMRRGYVREFGTYITQDAINRLRFSCHRRLSLSI